MQYIFNQGMTSLKYECVRLCARRLCGTCYILYNKAITDSDTQAYIQLNAGPVCKLGLDDITWGWKLWPLSEDLWYIQKSENLGFFCEQKTRVSN